MYRVQKRQTLGFESLVRLIKQLADDSNPGNSPQILNKLGLIIERAVQLAVSHPFHAPVIALQIAKVTSKLDIQGRYRCVTCGGSCEDIHVKLVQAITPQLQYLPPKGLTQLQAVYSPCLNPHVWPTTLQLELRNALLIYRTLRRKVKQTDSLDAGVTRQLDLICTGCEAAISQGSGDNSWKMLHEQFYSIRKQCGTVEEDESTDEHHLDVNLRDICAAVTSVRADSPIRTLMLYLGNKTIEQMDTNTLDSQEIKSFSRIVHCLCKSEYPSAAVNSIARNIKTHARNMNVRDIACLMTAISPDNKQDVDEILERVEELLHGAEESVDMKSMSILIKQMAKFCEATGKPKYVGIITLCCDTIIRNIMTDPTSISRREIFTAVVVTLRTVYSLLQYQESLYPQFMELWESCMDCQNHWILTESAYDLNEMLSLLVDMSSSPRNARMQHSASRTRFHEISKMITVVDRRLCGLYQASIDEFDRDAGCRDTSLMRNLCQFLRIRRRHNIKECYGIDRDFNSDIYRLLLKHNAEMKPIDVVDLSRYLKHIYVHSDEVNEILKQTEENRLM